MVTISIRRFSGTKDSSRGSRTQFPGTIKETWNEKFYKVTGAVTFHNNAHPLIRSRTHARWLVNYPPLMIWTTRIEFVCSGSSISSGILDWIKIYPFLRWISQDIRWLSTDIRNQLVVVGDQSSGKSSLLEGLTGLSFPVASELCTRHATQIVLRRTQEEEGSVKVSIIPGPSASDSEKHLLEGFARTLNEVEFTAEAFKTLLEEVRHLGTQNLRAHECTGCSANGSTRPKHRYGDSEQALFRCNSQDRVVWSPASPSERRGCARLVS